MAQLPDRKGRHAFHVPPNWVDPSATFFITINCKVRGLPQLTKPGCIQIIFETTRIFMTRGRWWPEILLLMPDHVHALVSFSWDVGDGINRVIQDWKRYMARHGAVAWQRDYFDHRIRSEKDHQATWDYIVQNPVRAGLVEHPDDWPHVWLPGRDGSPSRPEG